MRGGLARATRKPDLQYLDTYQSSLDSQPRPSAFIKFKVLIIYLCSIFLGYCSCHISLSYYQTPSSYSSYFQDAAIQDILLGCFVWCKNSEPNYESGHLSVVVNVLGAGRMRV